MAVLDRHRGRENCIGMGELWRKVFRRPYTHRINDTSELRVLIRRLRRQGEPICSSCDSFDPGYYLAATAAEMEEFAARHQRRGLTSLAQAARLRRIALPELLGQLKLEAEEQG
jgi:hypothetical protein